MITRALSPIERCGSSMKLPSSAHTSRRWRIHELTGDFRLEDVWALPTPGGPDDLPWLVSGFASGEFSRGSSRAASTLWAIRWKVSAPSRMAPVFSCPTIERWMACQGVWEAG